VTGRPAGSAAPAADRGWNCLVFEGPGQWGPVFDQPPLLLRPDWEKPVTAVADYAETRPEIDTQRLALIGYSLGGYLAPRAAAMEPRIRACIASWRSTSGPPSRQRGRGSCAPCPAPRSMP
jgi:pimeloyl-ACP methyl ester carboxylesterase